MTNLAEGRVCLPGAAAEADNGGHDPESTFPPATSVSWPRFQTIRGSRTWLTWLTGGLVAVIGLADFWLGTEVSLELFYFIPVALAVMARGRSFGLAVSLACVVIWLGGDLAAGAHFTSWVVPVWNALITLTSYAVLVWLIASLLELQHDLERRVELRTRALAAEIAERQRLEKSILEVSERERLSIGHDLHDGLGQHLTGTAVTAQLLAETLADRRARETELARKIVELVKAGIAQTRVMAKGLLLADIDSQGLALALAELCSSLAEQHGVSCVFRNESPALPPLGAAANHLFRIAQEAVRNAIRHGGSRRINVNLRIDTDRLALEISDDGGGLPPPAARGAGLGLRIMAHRAAMIGAGLVVADGPAGGTVVRCELPLPIHE